MDEVKIPLEDELAMAYAGRQEEKALRESDRRCVSHYNTAVVRMCLASPRLLLSISPADELY